MGILVPPPPSRLRDISRHTFGSDLFDTLAPIWDIRWIVVAQGVEFSNALWEDMAVNFETNPNLTVGRGRHRRPITDKERRQAAKVRRGMKIPHSLQPEFPDMLMWDDRFALYYSADQGVIFYIQVVDTKTALKEAISTEKVHMIYYGHARYGRGPCFYPGSSTDPGEWWGEGTSEDNGIFRMGFPYLAVSMAEIFEHGYTPTPLVPNGIKPARKDCDRDLRPHLGEMKERTLQQLCADPNRPTVERYDPITMSALFLPGARLDTKLWSYKAVEPSGKLEWHVVLDAGWKDTPAAPMDLGATEIKCKVFCHFGCSTYVHNYEVLRKLRAWQKTEDDRFAYWTTKPSPGPVTRFWIRSLFKYGKYNAHSNWEPSLQYAVKETNRLLRNEGYLYRVI